MLKQEDEREVTVTKEDQDRINLFSKLLNERRELEAHLQGRKQLVKLYEDASDELILADDDEMVQDAVGDTFFVSSKDDVQEKVDESKEILTVDIADTEAKVNNLQEQLKALRSSLYAKFGNTINLEEQD